MSSIRVRRLLVAAVVLWAAAATTYATLRLTYGYRPAYVHVRWAPEVDAETRHQWERVHSLTAPRLQEGRTWSYYLTDVSTANIRALVANAAAEDTHYIHRTAFRPWRTAPRGEYAGSKPAWIAGTLEALVWIFLALGAAALGLAALAITGVPSLLRPAFDGVAGLFVEPRPAVPAAWHGLLGWFERRIPYASAEAVGIFRIVFGLCLLPYFLWKWVGPEWIERAAPESGLQGYFIGLYEAAPVVTAWVGPWIVVWCLLFVAGAASRTSYAMLTAGVVAWGFVYTARVGSHQVQVPLVAMLCLLWSRWGDALSVDAWLRRRRHQTAADRHLQSRRYGYTMWMPGVVVAASFAAAAFAKMRESGLAWITNGSVKYHFLSDGSRAPIELSQYLAQNEILAVLMSFAGVALEAGVIVAVLSTDYRYRLAGGIGVIALVMTFWLFQGLFWPFWAIMALSFLPWHRIGRGPSATGSMQPLEIGPALRSAQVLTVLLLLAVQVVASVGRIEYAPFISAWDMYSTTYASTAEFEEKAGMKYWIVAELSDGTSTACIVDGEHAKAISARWGKPLPEELRRVIDDCFRSVPPVRQISVEARRPTFDWERWAVAEDLTIPMAEPIPIELVR